jgi:hypothetical protein
MGIAALKPDPQLLDFCTARQRELLQACMDHPNQMAAAKAMGVRPQVISAAVSAIKKKAALRGYAPEADMVHATVAPFVVKGTSTLYDDLGNQKLQWVKTQLDAKQVEEAVREWIESLTQAAKGMSPLIAPPKHTNADLLAVYPIGDPHIGMYSWAAETGADFNADIAERQIQGAVDRLVNSAPPAETGLILELGDLIHADNSKNLTLRSNNTLDVDTRWGRVMQIGLRIPIYAVKRALSKHKRVIVRIVKGNHDEHSSFAIALALDAYFHNNPRVTVDLSPAEHWYYRFGKVLIGVTHGDKAKFPAMPGIMACDRPQDWGATRYRHWYQGHIHHEHKVEYPGCVVEAFRTLAARDAWHAGEGYRAGRDMCLIVHHREYGEIERHRCDLAMIEGVK